MSTRPSAALPIAQVARLRLGVRQVGAIQGVRVYEDRHSVAECDAVFRCVGRGLPRVHSNTIQYIRNAAG